MSVFYIQARSGNNGVKQKLLAGLSSSTSLGQSQHGAAAWQIRQAAALLRSCGLAKPKAFSDHEGSEVAATINICNASL
jgi:hypothetical protein